MDGILAQVEIGKNIENKNSTFFFFGYKELLTNILHFHIK
ncbi:hypothetical protein SAMN05443246_1192 [Paenibacillus sp. GP183]|nr:hypothetical protein SAMN05443246_1192 [Paenibacillus sp. GP183]